MTLLPLAAGRAPGRATLAVSRLHPTVSSLADGFAERMRAAPGLRARRLGRRRDRRGHDARRADRRARPAAVHQDRRGGRRGRGARRPRPAGALDRLREPAGEPGRRPRPASTASRRSAATASTSSRASAAASPSTAGSTAPASPRRSPPARRRPPGRRLRPPRCRLTGPAPQPSRSRSPCSRCRCCWRSGRRRALPGFPLELPVAGARCSSARQRRCAGRCGSS